MCSPAAIACLTVLILVFSVQYSRTERAEVPVVAAELNPCAPYPVEDQQERAKRLQYLAEKYTKGEPFSNPPVVRPTTPDTAYALVVEYTKQKSIAGCPVELRSYNGELVGSTIRVKAGDTIYLKLINKLPRDAAAEHPQDPPPHGHGNGFSFNITNLHTHGLHVSPSGNSDNVFLTVHPSQAQDYEIRIPANHPAGMFWYHAHFHGSTGVQVASGMAGALIIEGGTDANGGLDTVPEIKAADEKIFVLQQINFDQNGRIEDFKQATPDNFQRSITVNGSFVPTIKMRPGEVQRWRFIHAGVSENIHLSLDSHLLYEIAADGIALGRLVPWPAKEDVGPEPGVRSLLLGPGYRSEVLVQAGKPSEYFLRDEELPQQLSLRAASRAVEMANSPSETRSIQNLRALQVGKPANVIARVVVEGPPVSMNLPKSDKLKDRVPTALKHIEASELNDTPQSVRFDAGRKRTCTSDGDCSQLCTGGGCPPYFKTRFTVNGRVFMGTAPDRLLAFGRASEWTVSGDAVFAHPFHIHVNPFELQRSEPDESGMRTTQWIWKDTILLPSDGSSIQMRSRYTEFEGDFVLHCHILGHEDQGMMEWVRIAVPK
jgi:FtsP/CotA-like multicopper oxidase with cupredoxin domain